MPSLGYTFLAKRPNFDAYHLYIVIAIVGEKLLFVGVTSYDSTKDNTCILKKGDHPFIKRDSVIAYFDATETEVGSIKQAASMNAIIPQKPVHPEILKRIQQGATDSPHLDPELRKYFP